MSVYTINNLFYNITSTTECMKLEHFDVRILIFYLKHATKGIVELNLHDQRMTIYHCYIIANKICKDETRTR